jgi:hypothetical protein
MPSFRLALVLAAALAGCAVHDAKPAFRAGVVIGHRGIVVPLPPPSLTSEPEQTVEIHGELTEDAEVANGTVLHVHDAVSDAMAQLVLQAGQRDFTVTGLVIDVGDNCLELWLEQADGREGEHAFYSTEIVGEQELEVVEGCG